MTTRADDSNALTPAPDAADAAARVVELTVLMPCLNEEQAVVRCVEKARCFFAERGISGEVLVVDNGSTDGSRAAAEMAGARVVGHEERGYGSALKRGIAEARGSLVVMGDADGTYDFARLGEFVDLLRSGYDLVMGTRLGGVIERRAMPWSHRYLGTPVLTALVNLFYRIGISDVNCGIRGFRRTAIAGLHLRSSGMEFASEMVIRASQDGLRIAETPVTYAAAAADRQAHLRTWRDGWRHLRFMLILSPTYLFLYPGLVTSLAGSLLTALLLLHPVAILGIPLGLSAILFACLLMFVGLQGALFGVFGLLLDARGPGKRRVPPIARFFLRSFTVERGLAAGGLVLVLGLALGATTVRWLLAVATPGVIHAGVTRLSIIATFVTLLGFQIMSFSFFLGLAHLDKTLE